MAMQEYNDATTAAALKKIMIVGLPNTGKSQVFNILTGKYTLVANYPHTTVEIHKSRTKLGTQMYEVADTPGLHSLYVHSEDEIVIRDMLFFEKPDILIQCIDANQLKQSLMLYADLAGLGIPTIMCLNAISETTKKGIQIDTRRLSEELGIPVVKLVSLQDRGREKLSKAIDNVKQGPYPVHFEDVIEKNIAEIESMLPQSVPYTRKTAVLLLEHDRFLEKKLQGMHESEAIKPVLQRTASARDRFSGNIGKVINNTRSIWVEMLYNAVVKKTIGSENEFLRLFASMSRHPVFGVPILLLFVFLTFLSVVHVAGFFEEFLSTTIVDPTVSVIAQAVGEGFWHDFLVGHYGVLTLGLFNAFCTVLPILSVFFIVFGFMEDIGYIPNLVVLTKRLFEKIGLTGKAIMPLVLGLGCKTMATLMTRGLSSRKEKFIAVYLIAFAIPCSAQLAIDMGILGRIGFKAFVISYGMLVLVEIIAGAILNKILPQQEKSDFIQELPPIRIPNIKALLVKTYYRLYWFLKEAVPIFIIAAIVLFTFDKTGILNLVKIFLRPIVDTWLGLPVDIVDVLILTIARHEAAAGLLLNMVDAGALSYIQCIVAVVITTMFVPCFANIVAMCKEMGVKTGLIMMFAINISSFVLGGILRWILEITL